MRDGAVNLPVGGAWFGVAEFPGRTNLGGMLGLPCSDGANRSAPGSGVCARLGAAISARAATSADTTKPVSLRGRQRRGTCDLLAPKPPLRVTSRAARPRVATRHATPRAAAGPRTAG